MATVCAQEPAAVTQEPSGKEPPEDKEAAAVKDYLEHEEYGEAARRV
jgi:hypothetical protein